MKKVCLFCLLATCLAVTPAFSVNAQQDFGNPKKAGFYVDYEIGVRFLDLEEEPGISADIDAGVVNSLSVGYADGNGWRGELVSSFGRNNYKATATIDPTTSVTIDSSFDIYTGLVRGFYDFALSGEITPFIGLGVGYSKVESSARVAGTSITVVASDNYFTYSGIAGFRFAATDNFSIGARYGFSGYGGDGDFAHDAMASFSYAF